MSPMLFYFGHIRCLFYVILVDYLGKMICVIFVIYFGKMNKLSEVCFA